MFSRQTQNPNKKSDGGRVECRQNGEREDRSYNGKNTKTDKGKSEAMLCSVFKSLKDRERGHQVSVAVSNPTDLLTAHFHGLSLHLVADSGGSHSRV